MGEDRNQTETDLLVDSLETELPDDAAISPKGLLGIFHATTAELKKEWSRAGIENVLGEVETEELHSPRTSDGAPSLTDDSGPAQIKQNSRLWEAAILAIQRSLGTHTNIGSTDPIVDFKPAVQYELGVQTNEVLEALNVTEGSNRLDPEFQTQCFVETLLHLYENIERSTLTEREFASFHVSTRYPPKEAAEFLSEVFGTEQSAGTIRKYNSRARKKREQATATVEALKDIRPTDEIRDFIAGRKSLLSNEQKRQVSQITKGIITTQDDKEEVIELDKGIDLHLNPERNELAGPDEWGKLQVCFFHPISTLPEPIAVDVNHTENTEMVSDEGDDLTLFGQISSEYHDTRFDVTDAIDHALRQTDFQPDVDMDITALTPTGAHTGSDGGTVCFTTFIELTR